MSSITIYDLPSTGSELFFDSESYMNELSNEEFNQVIGGTSPAIIPVIYSIAASSEACGIVVSSAAFFAFNALSFQK